MKAFIETTIDAFGVGRRMMERNFHGMGAPAVRAHVERAETYHARLLDDDKADLFHRSAMRVHQL